SFMRIVRSAVLPVRDELYVQAARVSGLSRPYIVTRHVLPRISGVVIVQASLFAGAALLAPSGLAYLGLFVQQPTPSWGGMLADGITVILAQPWLIWPPGVVITLTVLALGLLGDAVRDTSVESWAPTASTRGPRPVTAQSTVAANAPAKVAGALLSVE